MDEPRVVCDGERVAQRREHREHLSGRKRTALLQYLAQARPFEILEHEKRTAVGQRSVAERTDDVGMAEPFDRFLFALKSRQRVDGADELEMEDLDRDARAILGDRVPHLTEPTFTDQPVERVARNEWRWSVNLQQAVRTIARVIVFS